MILDYFDRYIAIGLKPIAIIAGTKRPIGKNWNQKWNAVYWRNILKKNPNSNLGLLLGDIIDVEGDTEEANEALEQMIEGVPHPKYQSSRSVHHLFLTPDANLTKSSYANIEFRGRLHQSLAPPSRHEAGMEYRFLKDSRFPIPPMPEKLIQFYNKHCRKSESINRLKKGYCKSYCRICDKFFYIHKKRLVLEVKAFKQDYLPWMCHGCRELDVRGKCRHLRRQTESHKNPNLDVICDAFA